MFIIIIIMFTPLRKAGMGKGLATRADSSGFKDESHPRAGRSPNDSKCLDLGPLVVRILAMTNALSRRTRVGLQLDAISNHQ